MNKVYVNAEAAKTDIPNSATTLAGGFDFCGITEYLIDALLKRGKKDLSFISNNAGKETASQVPGNAKCPMRNSLKLTILPG